MSTSQDGVLRSTNSASDRRTTDVGARRRCGGQQTSERGRGPKPPGRWDKRQPSPTALEVRVRPF
eukprot:14673290-Alexandrium_andersonii.AAC.1